VRGIGSRGSYEGGTNVQTLVGKVCFSLNGENEKPEKPSLHFITFMLRILIQIKLML